MKTEQRFDTLLQHGGYDPKEHGGHRGEPLYLDVAMVQPSCEEAAKNFATPLDYHTYYRFGGRNEDMVARRLALLEGAEGAKMFASGLGAILCAVLALCEKGDHIVSQNDIYGGTRGTFAHWLPRLGNTVTFVKNINDPEELGRAIRERTKIIFTEIISNPTLNVLDVEAVASVAQKKKVKLIVDNTFATPVLFRPLEYGAALSIHSTTKYMNLGSTNGGGAVVGTTADLLKINDLAKFYGAPMSAFDAWLTLKGLSFLGMRIAKQSANALALAKFLAGRPEVEKVYYPGLMSSPNYFRAKKYLPEGCGGMVAFELKGTKADAVRFMDSLKLISDIINLGDMRTSAVHPASTTHSGVPEADRCWIGITDTFIRLSSGIEDIEDLKEDIEQAFKKAQN